MTCITLSPKNVGLFFNSLSRFYAFDLQLRFSAHGHSCRSKSQVFATVKTFQWTSVIWHPFVVFVFLFQTPPFFSILPTYLPLYLLIKLEWISANVIRALQRPCIFVLYRNSLLRGSLKLEVTTPRGKPSHLQTHYTL